MLTGSCMPVPAKPRRSPFAAPRTILMSSASASSSPASVQRNMENVTPKFVSSMQNSVLPRQSGGMPFSKGGNATLDGSFSIHSLEPQTDRSLKHSASSARDRKPCRSPSAERSATPRLHPQDSVQCMLQRALSADEIRWKNDLLGHLLDKKGPPPQGSPPLGRSASLPAPAKRAPDLPKQQQLLAALFLEIEALSDKTDNLAHTLAESQVELRRHVDSLCSDLEVRLTTQVVELRERIILDAGSNARETIQQSPDLIENKGFLNQAFESSPCDPGPECAGASSSESRSHEDEPRENAKLIIDISDHVIARMKSDPRICQLVNSYQSIQESFTSLLGMLNESPWLERESGADINSLMGNMIDTQKNCKSIALELRQLRQRRNQDFSDSEIRFVNLERKLKALECNLVPDTPLKIDASNSDRPGRVKEVREYSGEFVQQYQKPSASIISEVVDEKIEQSPSGDQH